MRHIHVPAKEGWAIWVKDALENLFLFDSRIDDWSAANPIDPIALGKKGCVDLLGRFWTAAARPGGIGGGAGIATCDVEFEIEYGPAIALLATAPSSDTRWGFREDGKLIGAIVNNLGVTQLCIFDPDTRTLLSQQALAFAPVVDASVDHLRSATIGENNEIFLHYARFNGVLNLFRVSIDDSTFGDLITDMTPVSPAQIIGDAFTVAPGIVGYAAQGTALVLDSTTLAVIASHGSGPHNEVQAVKFDNSYFMGGDFFGSKYWANQIGDFNQFGDICDGVAWSPFNKNMLYIHGTPDGAFMEKYDTSGSVPALVLRTATAKGGTFGPVVFSDWSYRFVVLGRPLR